VLSACTTHLDMGCPLLISMLLVSLGCAITGCQFIACVCGCGQLRGQANARAFSCNLLWPADKTLTVRTCVPVLLQLRHCFLCCTIVTVMLMLRSCSWWTVSLHTRRRRGHEAGNLHSLGRFQRPVVRHRVVLAQLRMLEGHRRESPMHFSSCWH